MPITQWLNWMTPVAILLVALLVGLWLRSFFVTRLLRWASQTRWEGDEIVLHAVRNPIVLWSVMAGVYCVMKIAHLPAGIVAVAEPILKALWIFSVAWVIANTISELITHYAAKWQLGLPMTSLTQNLAKGIILALGLLIVLDSLGVKIASLLAALGIGSLAVALGLQDTLANLFAGIYLTLSKNIRVRDYIKLQSGEEGYITDIGWRATKIHMLPNNVVIVPNTKLAQSVIINCYLPDKELAVLVEVSADYGSDLEHVERVSMDVAREVMRQVAGGVPAFEPLVRFHTFGESSVNFTVVMRAREFVDQYVIKHEFIKRLHARYRSEGISFASPVRTMVVKSEASA
ncbi:MAG: mechanosensitive ion channel family protein [Candidatus Omnitrophica bacterium]|nr:mechanosensitive ion channel family protein [Candidatus Omnitrophota bacterium]